eukprot:9026563-Karenia_brevis.AAC.1
MKVLWKKGVSTWIDELVQKEGDEEAKRQVVQEIAEELIEKSKKLSSTDVEIKVPKELVEEARGSSSSSSVKPKSLQEIKRRAGEKVQKWTELEGGTECTEGVGG